MMKCAFCWLSYRKVRAVAAFIIHVHNACSLIRTTTSDANEDSWFIGESHVCIIKQCHCSFAIQTYFSGVLLTVSVQCISIVLSFPLLRRGDAWIQSLTNWEPLVLEK